MSAINYDFMDRYMSAKEKQNELKNKISGIPSMPAFMQNGFAFGGDLQINGADFPTKLTHIDAGGSHSENPNDGVQMGVDPEGTPNLVEENETVFNDYVYSNRIFADGGTLQKFHLPKKAKLTFAEISKKLEKEIKERPNDPISQAGFNAQMEQLQEEQERQKQEMEAERAKAAFEALSPEEQTALMQQKAQQEAMAQQAAQEQVMAEQQAAIQQATPEELAMAQQAQMQADGTQAMVGQEAPMMAYGGKVNRFDIGGEIMKMLGAHTWSDFVKWAKENKAFDDSSEENSSFWDGVDGPDKVDWKVMLENESFRKALSKDNPALAHALRNNYDFGAYVPDNSGNITFKDISKGNWTAQDYEGWKDSQDPAWLEAVKKGLVKEGMKQEDIAKALRQTDSYKRGNKWLQDNEDNRLRYLRTILEDDNSPEVAKNYARKFIDENGWKKGAARDYESIFGANGKGVRETHPGTYWHTPVEAIRGAQTKNYVINDDGNIEEIYGNVPTEWTAAGNYSWATPENDLTYNYYRRPAPAASEEAKTPEQKAAEEESGIVPRRRWEGLRYAGLLGPAVGLGMQALGIGRPDTSGIDAAVNAANGPVSQADWMPIGDYMAYKPNDPWFYTSPIMAQSNATQRSINNTINPSRNAASLANSYNTMIALGKAQREQLDSNYDRYAQSKGFNRGTNQFNAQSYNQNQQFNADARNRARQYGAQIALQGAAQKMDADAGWYNGLYGNVAGLFKGLGDIGRENVATNWRNALTTAGAFGAMDEDELVRADISKYKNGKKSAKGGRIKKGKRGLTI